MNSNDARDVCGKTATASSPPPSPSPAPVAALRTVFACRRCRATLFHLHDALPHEPGDSARKEFKYRRGGPQTQNEAVDGASAAEACTSYFLDPDVCPWVAEELREANALGAAVEPDTIYCPNQRCHAKLGTQSWTGSRCSCGAWVTPAFRIHARAVDKMTDYGPSP